MGGSKSFDFIYYNRGLEYLLFVLNSCQCLRFSNVLLHSYFFHQPFSSSKGNISYEICPVLNMFHLCLALLINSIQFNFQSK